MNINYSLMDLSTSKSNTLKVNRKGIERSSLKEIIKYSNNLIKSPESNPFSGIIDSKKIIIKEEKNLINKSLYYDKVDMLRATKENEVVIQKYLRSFTTLDIELAQNQNTTYEFKPITLASKILNKNVYKILEYSFFEMSSVISTPNFYVTPNMVIINLFYFVINKKLASSKFLDLNLNKLEGLSNKLSKYFNRPVKLDLTQLYSVSNNTQILAHILGKLGLLRRNSFSRIINRFLKYQSNKILFRKNQNKYNKLFTVLTGVNINLGGRLMRGKIIPRRTTNKIQYGSLARSKSNYITNSRTTMKNKRGSFSFTVSIGHKFF
jgi:hypothetical protein